MEKISVSNIVEFKRKKTENSQRTFVNNLKNVRVKEDGESGGNYWVHSLSTINNVFESGQNKQIGKKIDIIREKIEAAVSTGSKNMYLRNIEILQGIENINFSDFKPKFDLDYLPKPKSISILSIRNIPVQILPNHVFTFKEKGVGKIGAIWFVSKLGGYSSAELGLFTDALYRYLKMNYSKNFNADSNFCTVFDVVSLTDVNHQQILNKTIKSELNSTLDLIHKFLN